MVTSSWLTCADFAPHVGDSFTVSVGDSTLVLSLLEAVESGAAGGPGPEGRTRQQFVVEFCGPLEPALEQGIVSLTHPVMGDLDLFLVPIGRTPEGLRYEAAFA